MKTRGKYGKDGSAEVRPSVYLSRELNERVVAAAKAMDVSVAEWFRQAAELMLREMKRPLGSHED